VIREQALKGVYTLGQQKVIQKYQQGAIGWRPARLRELLRMFSNRAYLLARKDEAELKDFVKENMGGEANVDRLWRETLRLLEEEIAAVKAAFEEEKKAQERKDAADRDACLAPEGETWEMLVRQEMALDRSIDRKVKIILSMRKEHAQQPRGGSRTAPRRAPSIPDEDQRNDPEAQELSKLVGLDPNSEVAPTSGARPERSEGSAGAGQKASATSLSENAAETPKSPEQSENVIENKGPAAEASTHGGRRASGKGLPTGVPHPPDK
jgi:hypothetical protein